MNKYFDNLALRIGALSLMLMALATSCVSESDQPKTKPAETEKLNVFVVNSGNFGKGNASLDLYLPSTKTQRHEIFLNTNGTKLGDVAQSASLFGNSLYVVVGNSNVIYRLDPMTHKRTGQMDIESPRYIYFVSAEKAYVSHLGSGDITVINPKSMNTIGKITTYQSGNKEAKKYDLSTERWLKADNTHVLVSCWSNNSKVLLIDTTQDKVVKEIEVGLQPKSMGMDQNGKVWVLCEGQSWKGTNPCIWTIDTKNNYAAAQVGGEIQKLPYLKYAATSDLVMNLTRDAFYYFNAPHIYKMSITDKEIPTTPFIAMPENCNTYSLAVAPNGELYIGDAKDYQQGGTVYRFCCEGKQIDKFEVGLLPIDYVFYFKR
ncbi:YncE family protein [Porphyromonas levii]|uniref:YncE family protein n=1 Tax=Porphyromonas levii TaxID=28114 RepID=UPI001B8D525E|nr:DUF5074 domain-containing protein [Porphyromonas levii]MBR8729884.1 hypothetical protein [Porphyromonas levii]MBR8731552.1 hypothetical protein [Porphyromonas levii]MBR8806762.1 hypothetical protein [Porphyromonas levii]